MNSRLIALALVTTIACANAVRAVGDPQWLKVTTPNFVVYSDAGEKRARETAERLEGFRALLASLFPKIVGAAKSNPVPVVAFKSDGDYQPYKPLYNGKPANVAGLFLGGDEQAMITLDVSAWTGSSHVVFHEYIHRLLAGNDAPIPLWFNEGAAEFYSTATTSGSKGQIGKIVPGHLDLLQQRGFLPLENLFSVNHDSPDYNERDRQSVFYAESWALVHYCVLDATGKRSGQLIDFATRQGRGEPVASAFRAAFGQDTTEVEKALGVYIRQAVLPIFNLTFPQPIEVEKATAEPAPPVEVEYQLGTALSLEQRYDDAVPHFRRGLELDPPSALPHEGLGFVALRKNDVAAARTAFGEATKHDSTNTLALYYFGLASMGFVEPGTPATIRTALERAVALDPTFAPAYELLAVLALQADDPATATTWSERGLKVAPQNGRLRVDLASAQARAGKTAEARENLRRVLELSDDEASRSYARTLLEQLDAVESRASSASATSPENAPASGTPMLVRADLTSSDLSGGGDVGLGDQHIRVADGEVRGLVTRIDCDGKRLTVHVLVDGRELAFTCEDTSSMILGTLKMGSLDHESVDCGKKMSREAFVQFDPETAGAMAGPLKALIFVEPTKK